MIRPVRLRLSRKKGFDLQAHSRGINGLPGLNAARPGVLGNPFIVGKDGNREDCFHCCAVVLKGWIVTGHTCTVSHARQTEYWRRMLHRIVSGDHRGHNIYCWCELPKPGAPDICHGALLLEAFNR